MKKYLKNSILLIIVIAFIVFAVVSGKTEKEKTNRGISLEFEQVGYYKSDHRLRYFTFFLKSSPPLNIDSIPDEVYDKLRKHGEKQMNTPGRVTASFYYIEKSSVPDITLLDEQRANAIVHERKPIVAVWIMPTGKINLIKNPE